MINIIKSDVYRIVRNKAFYIALAVLILILGISIYMVQPGMIGNTGAMPDSVSAEELSSDEVVIQTINDISQSDIDLSLSNIRKIMLKAQNYELDKDIAAQNMNLYYVFIFIAAIIITTDFSNRSVKNTLSSAISRNKYFFSKVLLVNFVCIALFLLNNYLAHFGNIIFNSRNISASLETISKVTLLQIPPILAIANILTGFAFMFRKNSIFNTVAIPFIMVFQIAAFTVTKILDISDKFLNYELQTMFSRLAYDPGNSYIVKSCIVCAVIAIIFNLIGYVCFKKSEVK